MAPEADLADADRRYDEEIKQHDTQFPALYEDQERTSARIDQFHVRDHAEYPAVLDRYRHRARTDSGRTRRAPPTTRRPCQHLPGHGGLAALLPSTVTRVVLPSLTALLVLDVTGTGASPTGVVGSTATIDVTVLVTRVFATPTVQPSDSRALT